VKEEDFDSPVCRQAAKWLIEGKPFGQFIDQLDEGSRRQLMVDINSDVLPSEQQEALDMARELLEDIRKVRRSRRVEEIKAEMATASHERKQELYVLLDKLLKEQRS